MTLDKSESFNTYTYMQYVYTLTAYLFDDKWFGIIISVLSSIGAVNIHFKIYFQNDKVVMLYSTWLQKRFFLVGDSITIAVSVYLNTSQTLCGLWRFRALLCFYCCLLIVKFIHIPQECLPGTKTMTQLHHCQEINPAGTWVTKKFPWYLNYR